MAVEAARKQSVSNDTIKRAIQRLGEGDGADYETVLYEAWRLTTCR